MVVMDRRLPLIERSRKSVTGFLPALRSTP
jgi:hypothetical protein